MEKVFIYCRVSDSSQKSGDGFQRQIIACENYAKANSMEIANVYMEDHTGTEYDRPELAKLMVNLEMNGHGIKKVLCERLDRVARDVFVQEKIIADFRDKGFVLISTMEGSDLCSDDPTREMIRLICGVFAQYDKKMLVSKMKAARDRMRARTGHCEGRKGYNDTEEGYELIRHIKALRRRPKYGKQRTLFEVAEHLNNEGIKTLDGKQWSLFRVQQVIK
jgi:DNA invertase Pin-like site-specific DNA recombinase